MREERERERREVCPESYNSIPSKTLHRVQEKQRERERERERAERFPPRIV